MEGVLRLLREFDARLWTFSPLDFTLDFVVGLLQGEGQLPDGQRVIVLPEEVVARIRVNPSLVWQFARTLTDAMQDYEDVFAVLRDFTDCEMMDSRTMQTDDGDETNE